VAGHGEYGNHLFGCMLGNTLAGAQVTGEPTDIRVG
jgi:hypothetical protein